MINRDDLPLVIVNPASAGGNTAKDWPGLAVRIRDHFGPFACAFTKRAGHAREIALTEAENGRKLILACGGDGTLSEVANGIIEAQKQPQNGVQSNTVLGLLPHGTGGDFRKTLDLPARFVDAVQALAKGVTRRIDAGEIDYIDHQGRSAHRYFINVSSLGLGGEVVKRVNSANKSLGGTIPFAYATLAATLNYQRPELWVQLDDGDARRIAITNISIANGRYFGGGMKIAPDAKLNDGLFDIVIIKDIATIDILANVQKLYAGTHGDLAYVSIKRAQKFTVRAVNERELVRIEVDGEAPGRLPATFRVVKDALSVLCPQ